MKKLFTMALLAHSCIECHAQTEKSVAQRPDSLPGLPTKEELLKIKQANIQRAATVQFQHFIIKADSGTYGYSIYADGNLYIQQTTIPGLGGTKGFADAASAATVAKLVIQKIKEGELPPTISLEDLQKVISHKETKKTTNTTLSP